MSRRKKVLVATTTDEDQIVCCKTKIYRDEKWVWVCAGTFQSQKHEYTCVGVMWVCLDEHIKSKITWLLYKCF
jgi:hypothetical protein